MERNAHARRGTDHDRGLPDDDRLRDTAGSYDGPCTVAGRPGIDRSFPAPAEDGVRPHDAAIPERVVPRPHRTGPVAPGCREAGDRRSSRLDAPARVLPAVRQSGRLRLRGTYRASSAVGG